MSDDQSGAICHTYLQDHFHKQLDPDLAAALNTATGLLYECVSFVQYAQLRAKGAPLFDEPSYQAILNRLRTLADQRDTINDLLGELVPAANLAAVFDASCAHAAAEKLFQRVWIRHHFTGSCYDGWCADQDRTPFELPDHVAIQCACERESFMAQVARGRQQRRPATVEVSLPTHCWQAVFACGSTAAGIRLNTLIKNRNAERMKKGFYKVKATALDLMEQSRLDEQVKAYNQKATAKGKPRAGKPKKKAPN